jgi:hypothetical protein
VSVVQAHVIYANGNALTHLAAGTFGHQPKLRKLYLHDNRDLASIEAGAFSNMTELRYLLLHYTALDSLPPGVFDGLPKLKILWLHNAALRRMPASDTCCFSHACPVGVEGGRSHQRMSRLLSDHV